MHDGHQRPDDLRALAAGLARSADRLETALREVGRRLVCSPWSGPSRQAFDEVLRGQRAELRAAAEALRGEADRHLREAARCERERGPGGGA